MATIYGEAEVRGSDTWVRPYTGGPFRDIPEGSFLVVEGQQFSGVSVVVIWGDRVSIATDPDPTPPGVWRDNRQGPFIVRVVEDRSRFERV